jgi:hypothetical protein
LRFIDPDPVGLRLGLEILNARFEPEDPEENSPQSSQRRQAVGFALIKPEHGRTERSSFLVNVDDRCALSGKRNTRNPAPVKVTLVPQPLAGLTQCLPENLGILLCPAGLPGKIGAEGYSRICNQPAIQVKDQSLDALGAVVDCQ